MEITPRFDQSVSMRIINDEISGVYGQELLTEIQSLIRFYNIYDFGADFAVEGAKDYAPAKMPYKKARNLINKEARFLFGKPPDFFVSVTPEVDNESAKEKAKQDASLMLNLVTRILKDNHFNKKLIQAAKDAFIARRVAAVVNFNEESGISVNFLPSLEFVAETDQSSDQLVKLICFYTRKDSDSKSNQEIYRKKYWMQDGLCWVVEEIRNGMDEVVETITPERKTNLPFIPAVIIINDGLSGDLQGESEIEQLEESESWYSKLANADMDAERKGMNPIKYAIDMSPESTRDLPVSPGSFWDLRSTQDSADGAATQGKVGMLEPSMTHSDPLSTTLDRIKNDMHEQLSVPDVSPSAMKGIVSSGKTLKAIYWDLIVRCDEKMQTWRPALEFIARCIIEGAKLYPNIAKMYTRVPVPDVEYSITVDNQYPLPEDETEEKQIDLQEVAARSRSVKSYLKKWQNLSDDEIDAEIKQIAYEQRLFEDSYTGNLDGEA